MKRLIALALLIFMCAEGRAQLYAMRDSVSNGYDFWLFRPEARDTVASPMPVVLFLHGQSLCGRDLYRVRRYGCVDALTWGRRIDAAIVAPQNPGGTWKPERLMNVLRWVEARYPVDTARIYVIGMSLGGFGAIDFAGTYPDRTAAAMALCGGGTLKDYSGLTRVPLWILHGTADRAVPIRESKRVVEAVNAADSNNLMRFTPLPGLNHSRLARIFYMEETYKWLFSHCLTDSLRTVDRECTIDAGAISTAYRGLHSGMCKLQVVDRHPADPGETPGADGARYHTIRQGDTLSALAVKYHTTVTRICRLNGIGRDKILRIGQRVRVD